MLNLALDSGIGMHQLLLHSSKSQFLKRIFEAVVAVLKECLGKMNKTLLHAIKKFCGLCHKFFAKKEFR